MSGNNSSGTSHPAYRARAVRRRPRAHINPARVDLAALVPRLTARDRWLLHMLHEHQVLTTPQITRLLAVGRRTVARRLRELYLLGVLDSFRPFLDEGSAPEHYTLGPAGAAVLAAQRAIDLAALGWRADHTGRVAHSPNLAHNVGRNDLLTRLAADHHTDPNRHLELWACERTCATLWGDHIHPDAYAHYAETSEAPGRAGARRVAFFLEYDTGTMRLARVANKLAGFHALAASTYPPTPTLLLIHTDTTRRESQLRARLSAHSIAAAVPVATSAHTLTRDVSPADEVWLPLGGPAVRRTLIGLTEAYPHLMPAPTAPGTWDLGPGSEPGHAPALPWPPAPPLPPHRRGI